jgi:threonylcarbamoyladenosine tRNA methylthiotransferase MtaB
MDTRPKVAFYTLGCKLNFSETAAISRRFEEEGYVKTGFESMADVYVINTCSVTEQADKECRRIVRSAQRLNPEAIICVVGCYAQLQPDAIAAIPGVDLVLGASDKFSITQYLGSLTKTGQAQVHRCEVEAADSFVAAHSTGDRTRAFLKVQDGCDYPCTYCTIPLARGISRSERLEKVVESARNLGASGIREVVLTGVNIGDYGKGEFGNKRHEHTFLELVQALDSVKEVERFRISSIEPNLVQPELIDFVATSKRFAPHFHMPLQSGSNTILKLMRRRYLRELYAERVERILTRMPHACIGVDVITGFPGEGEEEFAETAAFLRDLPVAYLHVFTYSERADTPAASMPGAVPQKIRQQRTRELRLLSARKRLAYHTRFLQQPLLVLPEAEAKEGRMGGYTANYVRCTLPYNEKLINNPVWVKAARLDRHGNLEATLISPVDHANAILQEII